jgi:AraC-like DNA-binding protein
MPIYMDRHDVSPAVTAEAVAHLHQEDLKIQDQFNCRALTYWFDGERQTAFCLVEAPNREALHQMHRHAHGEVPNAIIEVDPTVVNSFLGRITDPDQPAAGNLTLIQEPAFRVILMADNPPGKIADQFQQLIISCKGSMVHQYSKGWLASFSDAANALGAAESLMANGWTKIALAAGVPVTGRPAFFEEAVEQATQFFRFVKGEIVATAAVKNELEKSGSGLLQASDKLVTLNRQDESILQRLLEYTSGVWQDPEIKVTDFTRPTRLSKAQLYRAMIRIMGMAPNQFLKLYRLHQAAELLEQEHKTIAAVAYETGFGSPSYFAKCFQQHFGFPPSKRAMTA